MEVEEYPVCPSIKRGDYVKSKQGWAQPIGVVWDIHPRNIASVHVCYPMNGMAQSFRDYEPDELAIVPANEIPDELMKFRGTLERLR